jgi:hypothetical protein
MVQRCPLCFSKYVHLIIAEQYPDLCYFICGKCTHTDKVEFLIEKNFFVVLIKRILTLCKIGVKNNKT